MAPPLRLLVYDATGRDPLSLAWQSGAILYRGVFAVDAVYGARSWRDALAWLAQVQPQRAIGEIQFWGHGKWGTAMIGDDVSDIAATRSDHALHAALLARRATRT